MSKQKKPVKQKKEKFNLKERLITHSANRDVVDEIQEEIKEYIASKYSSSKKVRYIDWYIGITDEDDGRISQHKSTKKLLELKDFKSWQARSVSNARTIEVELCNEFKLKNCNYAGDVTEKTKRVYVFNLAQSKKKPKKRPKKKK